MRCDFGAVWRPNQAVILLRTPWPYTWIDPLERVLCKLTRCWWCNTTWGNRLELLHDRHTQEFNVPADDAVMVAFQEWMGWHYADDGDTDD